MKYNFQKIEKKWQAAWEKKKVFTAKDFGEEPKFYGLVEFPYPSGDGLHVGHVRSYTAMDVVARKRRMEGYNVLYPMGWDAFGLPTENYAIKTGVSPAVATKKNTENFKRQCKALGFSFDWDREIDTTDPKYYKWTQWIFLQLFKRGLAYKANVPINWCPSCKIGLANEEAVGGKCDRCGGLVEKRNKEQWMLKITAYADKLLDGLKTLDFLPEIKKQQENWIGRSEGAEIDFPLNWKSPEMDLVFATNNEGKIKRMQKLFAAAGLKISLKTPAEVGIKKFDVGEDGKTLAENAEKKARVVAAQTDLPVFADDSGFFIDGVEIDPVAVKRNALSGVDEKKLTIEEIGRRMERYYQKIAAARGGRVDAEWRNALCFITPEKIAVHVETIRPAILTDEVHGKPDPYLPLRSLYISKATGKYVLEQTKEEEMKELQPITDGIKKLFTLSLKVFTTRPDTIFGATYMALSPEHPFVSACIKRKALMNTEEIRAYVEVALKKAERDRAEEKEKTGVELKGVKAINPATKEEMPIFVADYVMTGYGTGAIMAVPAHDERDFEFAKKYKLPVKEVIAYTYEGIGDDAPKENVETLDREVVDAIIANNKGEFLLVKEKNRGITKIHFVGGGTEGEDEIEALKREVVEETGYMDFEVVGKIPGRINAYAFRHTKSKNQKTRGYCFYVRIKSEKKVKSEVDEGKHSIMWVEKERVANLVNWPHHLQMWHMFLKENKAFEGCGILINSGKFSGMDSEKAKWEITNFVGGKRTVQYKLRDWVFSRQRYWGEPIPLIFCGKCGWVPVPEEDLPVELPKVKDYRPRDDGQSPLASVTKWVNVKCPKCGGQAKRETDVMPNWAGSSWYYLAYLMRDKITKPYTLNPEPLRYWLPVDWYNGGMEHVTLHLLYSRFWNLFLHDIGVVPVKEPYKKRTAHGLILAEGGVKMSKSKGNVVNPDTLVKEFGADALRLYEMFIGPFDQAVAWDPHGIVGTSRFLERVFKLFEAHIHKEKRPESASAETHRVPDSFKRLIHKTAKSVTEDIEKMHFNTAVSALMILLNEAEKQAGKIDLPRYFFEVFFGLLAPFAPHITAELWEQYGEYTKTKTPPIYETAWPAWDEKMIEEDTFELVIQVNGKVRDKISVSRNISQEQAEKLALASEKVKATIGTVKPKKIIFVPGRLINFVV